MPIAEPVFVSISSLETHHPMYHKGDHYGKRYGTLIMKCGTINSSGCYEMPIRHAEKIARPCLNCFRELRRKEYRHI